MATALAVVGRQAEAASLPLRLLHAWHLLSLDAPTVAFCWTLLFAGATHVPQALPEAFALALAVWLIYAADRLLDAQAVDAGHAALPVLYRRHARGFVLAGALCAALLLFVLRFVTHAVLLGWAWLALPLLVYAAAVHRGSLPAWWKPASIGMFFAVAVAMPSLEQSGWQPALCGAALLFAELCRRNCALLQGRPSRVALSIAFFAGCTGLLFWSPVLVPIVLACASGYALLLWLGRKRMQLDPLTFRALADATLVVAALVVLAR